MHITIIGHGNVGTHLSRRAAEVGHQVNVWTRSQGGEIPTANLFIICVKDDAIAEVAAKLPHDVVMAHTSGSTSIDVLPQKRRGVLYPMQTFSKNKPLEWSEVPLFIEGDTLIEEFARSLNAKSVQYLSSKDRMKLHIAAVFACNFANHCYVQAAKLMESAGLDWRLLLPLIDETANKVHQLTPEAAQTGPAVRNDVNILTRHEEALPEDMRKLYSMLTRSIQSL